MTSRRRRGSMTGRPAMLMAVTALIVLSAPSWAGAARTTVPGAPAIIAISSIKKSNTTFDLKVSFDPPRSNGGSRILSTVVSAGGRSCTALVSRRSCIIRGLRAKSRVSVSARAANVRGFGKPGPSVGYVVGSKPWTSPAKVTPTTTTTIDQSRPYDVVVPTRLPASTRVPLVVLLHGYGATGAIQSAYMDFEAAAHDRGFLLVHPDGKTDLVGKQFWNATDACCNFFKSKVDDEGYLMSIIDGVSSRYPVDPKRIYLVGHSNGGFMTYRMACNHSGRIAAIAVLAGAMVQDSSRCSPSNSVSVLHVHGTNDETIAYTGGSILGNDYPGAEASVRRWVQSNSCSGTPVTSPNALDLVTTPSGRDTTTKTWSSCDRGTETALWTINGGTHVPSISTDFTARIVDFLLDHPKK